MWAARGVDGYAVHASIVDSKIILHDIGTANHRRVDGKPVHATSYQLEADRHADQCPSPQCNYRFTV